MRGITVAGLLIPSLLYGHWVYADCDNPKDDAERAVCLGVELRLSDAQINSTYETLFATLDEAGKRKLRAEQLDWLRLRNKVCQLDAHESDREKWFHNILQDYYKTVCVVRLTSLREAELKSLNQGRSGNTGQVGARGEAPVAISLPHQEIYDVAGDLLRSSGKWYFEVRLNVGGMAKLAETALFIGLKGNDGKSVGKLTRIRHKDVSAGPQVIGIAVDLDEGKLYSSENGAWLGGAPGSASGLDVKLGRNYVAVVSSSTSLFTPLRHGLIDINFGGHAFTYAPPSGYSPYQYR